MKNRIWLCVLCMVFLFSGCAGTEDSISYGKAENTGNTVERDEKDRREYESTEELCVYVCGFVEKPGVYSLGRNARICDALAMAGGVKEDGAGEALNQAEHVTDGQTVYVPSREELEAGRVESTEDGLININAAAKEELLTLPGIGEAKANAILSYREEHGSFETVEELMNIPGIKEGILEKMKPYIKVR